MAELLGVKIRIGGMWHARSYDPQDFLGRLIGDASWVRNAEMSMYDCYDDNFFATRFHIDLFTSTFWKDDRILTGNYFTLSDKLVGPMEYIEKDGVTGVGRDGKRGYYIISSQNCSEKQPEVFDYLAEQMPEYKFIKCQELNLSKEEYPQIAWEGKNGF